MSHLLVAQLRFARGEMQRCLAGISSQDACRRIEPMNCISWIVGHLANQENRYWNKVAQGKIIFPELNDLVGYGKPASTPDLEQMWAQWQVITSEADFFLDTLTPQIMQTRFVLHGKEVEETIGTMLLRNIYHYWFHTGEAFAIRQSLGHKDLPEFVGNMSGAFYLPE